MNDFLSISKLLPIIYNEVMTEDEFFIDVLHKIKAQIEEDLNAVNRKDGDNKLIADNYEESLKKMEEIFPSVNDLFDVYSLDEESFLFIVDAIEAYADSFIVDGRTPQALKKTTEEFELLQALVDQFYDDGDEEEDFEDDEDDEDYEEDESDNDD